LSVRLRRPEREVRDLDAVLPLDAQVLEQRLREDVMDLDFMDAAENILRYLDPCEPILGSIPSCRHDPKSTESTFFGPAPALIARPR
jgi:hypothetical protein